MIHIIKSNERGLTNISWLKSFHSFSFGDYYNPDSMHYGSLRVINDEYIAAGGGFPFHPHKNMEIITYVVDGSLKHEDSMGFSEIINKNEVQKMSAGTGIYHSEFNPSESESLHLFQIWIMPEKQNLTPYYEKVSVDEKNKLNKLLKVASSSGETNTVYVNSSAEMYISKIEKDCNILYKVEEGHGIYLQVVSGEISVGELIASAGDAVTIDEKTEVLLNASSDSEIILFDVVLA